MIKRKKEKFKQINMKIEVTKEAFDCLFRDKDAIKRDIKETHETIHFHNSYLEIKGFKVWNFASSMQWQYYLEDINL